ncbi:MAG: histidine phosphatase family protein [Chloroflexota bacterium]
MKRLILVRHGQTEWNIERRYQGQTDTQLTDFGRSQMLQTVEMLSSRSVDQIFSSPLTRAKESANIVAQGLNLEVLIEPRFKEMSLGTWEGQSYVLGRQTNEWFESAPHGGETGEQFRGRIKDWLQDQEPSDANSEKTILIVVHGLVVQVILSELLGEPFEVWHRRPIRNGAITSLLRKDWGWRLEKFNQERLSGKR